MGVCVGRGLPSLEREDSLYNLREAEWLTDHYGESVVIKCGEGDKAYVRFFSDYLEAFNHGVMLFHPEPFLVKSIPEFVPDPAAYSFRSYLVRQ